MEIIEAIRTRRSRRRYKPDPVPRKVLEEIIDVCQWSQSGQNIQPWKFAILGGDVMKKFKSLLTEKVEANAPPVLDFPDFELVEPYTQRAMDCMTSIDSYQFPEGTENLDQKRAQYWITGGRVYDAPNAVIVCLDRILVNWPWAHVSLGAIVQSFCLAALAHGVGTCVMARPVLWPDMLRELLGIPQLTAIICAIAVGYPDLEARINNFPRTRIPIDSWVSWHGF